MHDCRTNTDFVSALRLVFGNSEINMNRLSIVMLLTSATVSGAAAHGGHIASDGGHSHWIAVAAAVFAVAIAIGAFFLRSKKNKVH